MKFFGTVVRRSAARFRNTSSLHIPVEGSCTPQISKSLSRLPTQMICSMLIKTTAPATAPVARRYSANCNTYFAVTSFVGAMSDFQSMTPAARLSAIANASARPAPFLGTDFRYGSISTELGLSSHVRFTAGSDWIADIPDRQLRANRRHAGHRSLSAADVNAHGRLAARYDHSST